MQILDLRTESAEVLSALSALSTFYGDNTPTERRGLRTTIERRGTALNEEFLAAAESVIQVLSAFCILQAEVDVSKAILLCIRKGGGGVTFTSWCLKHPKHSSASPSK